MSWPEKRRRLAVRVATALGILTVLFALLMLIPIPYIIFAPGAAVDLNEAINVPGHKPPPGHFYLTDVGVLPGRPLYYLTAKALPGFEIIRRRELVPPNMSDRELDRELVDAMHESQMNAQIVAERAAGLPVKARSYFIVIKTVPGSPAARCFQRGDRIAQIDRRPVTDVNTLARVTTAKAPGSRFALAFARAGRLLRITCRTFNYKGKPRFGMTGQFSTEAYQLPVRVTYRVTNINGSSAGLMFALQIYRTLTGRDIAGGKNIAGTGVLSTDGTVLPVEGAREKVRAAIKSGAVVFLVPKENYAEISKTAGIKVIPIKSFADALRALSHEMVVAPSQGE